MKKEITWKTGNGREARAEIELVTERTVNADGYQVTTKCCEMEITAWVEGLGLVGSGRPQKINHPAVVAKIGNLGITAGTLARINDAIDEIEATPEWQAKLDEEKRIEREANEYDAHREMMRRAMRE